MRGEGEVGVTAAEVDHAQRAAGGPATATARGGHGGQLAQERVDLTALVGVGTERGEQRVRGIEQAPPGPVVCGSGGPTSRREVRVVCTCAWPRLGHPELDDPVGGLDVPVAERLGEQHVDGLGRRPGLVVAGGRGPAVGGDDLQPPPRLQLHRPQLGTLDLRVPAPAPSGRDSPKQTVDIKQQRTQPGERPLEIFRHLPILPHAPSVIMHIRTRHGVLVRMCMITDGAWGWAQTGRFVVYLTVFIDSRLRSEATPGSSPSFLVKKRW